MQGLKSLKMVTMLESDIWLVYMTFFLRQSNFVELESAFDVMRGGGGHKFLRP